MLSQCNICTKCLVLFTSFHPPKQQFLFFVQNIWLCVFIDLCFDQFCVLCYLHIMFVSFSHYILMCVLCFQLTTVHVHVHDKLLMIEVFSNKGCTCQCFMHLLEKVVLWFICRTRHFSVLFVQEFHAFYSETVLNICTVAKVGDNADFFIWVYSARLIFSPKDFNIFEISQLKICKNVHFVFVLVFFIHTCIFFSKVFANLVIFKWKGLLARILLSGGITVVVESRHTEIWHCKASDGFFN